MDFNFKSQFSLYFIIAYAIICFIATFFYYRKSSLKKPVKITLSFLRYFSFFILLILLLDPVLSLSKKIQQKPINIFLFDVSQSLKIENRDSVLKSVINKDIKSLNNGNYENKYFLFGNDLINEIELEEFNNIKFNGINSYKTDLSKTLNSLSKKLDFQNVSSINIYSDGNFNSGGNPIYSAFTPSILYNYYLIGDTIQKKDLLIKNVFFNKYAFTGNSTPVKVEIKSFDFSGKAKINLFEEDNIVDSKFIEINKNEFDYTIEFILKSDAAKTKKFKIEIEKQPDEITYNNNYQEFFIKFVDDKMKVLVISGGPGADFAYLTEEIKKIKNLDVTFLTQKNQNQYYEQYPENKDDFDVFLFIDFPNSFTELKLLEELKEQFSQRQPALILFTSNNTDFNKLSLLNDFLPFKSSGNSFGEFESGVNIISNLKQEYKILSETNQNIKNLPNIKISAENIILKPGTETLLYSTLKNIPVLSIYNSEKAKSSIFSGYGFYKWRLNQQNVSNNDLLRNILNNSIKILADKNKSKKLLLETNEQFYAPGEKINVICKINSVNINSNNTIKVFIRNGNNNTELQLKKKNNTEYEGEYNTDNIGDYRALAELWNENTIIERDSVRFSVVEKNDEYQYTKSNGNLLSELSVNSNGYYLNSLSGNEIKDILIKNSKNTISVINTNSFQIMNNNLIILMIIILLLSFEWFFRKRNNLP